MSADDFFRLFGCTDGGRWLKRQYLDPIEAIIKNPSLIPMHHPITVFGRTCHPKRRTQFYSNVKTGGYTYAGASAGAKPLEPWMQEMINEVNEVYPGENFDGLLINVYENNKWTIAKHRDVGLYDNGGVVAISYGASRFLRVRNSETGEIIMDHIMENGQALHMKTPEFQKLFTHEVPEKRVPGAEERIRISITFRRHIPPTPSSS